jgi:hypothetical protein
VSEPRAEPEVAPETLVQRAIESVLEQLPDVGDDASLEESPKYQPWAETVAPPSKNKRPLSELLAEYAARVAADPDAKAGAPAAKHPVAAFFDRFGPGRKPTGRRRGRGGRGSTGSTGAVPAGAGAGRGRGTPPPPPRPAGQRPPAQRPPDAGAPGEGEGSTGRRRRRRPSGRRGRTGGGGGGAPAPAGSPACPRRLGQALRGAWPPPGARRGRLDTLPECSRSCVASPAGS